MVIIGEMSYPPEQAHAVGKCFQAVSPLPEFMTEKEISVLGINGKIIRLINLYEFEDSRLPEAVAFVSRRYTSLVSVPSFHFAFQIRPDATDYFREVDFG